MISFSSNEVDSNDLSGLKRLTKIEELNGDGNYKLIIANIAAGKF